MPAGWCHFKGHYEYLFEIVNSHFTTRGENMYGSAGSYLDIESITVPVKVVNEEIVNPSLTFSPILPPNQCGAVFDEALFIPDQRVHSKKTILKKELRFPWLLRLLDPYGKWDWTIQPFPVNLRDWYWRIRHRRGGIAE
jgi:hypothetical protein